MGILAVTKPRGRKITVVTVKTKMYWFCRMLVPAISVLIVANSVLLDASFTDDALNIWAKLARARIVGLEKLLAPSCELITSSLSNKIENNSEFGNWICFMFIPLGR
jgi:hypothetical protein